MSLNSVLLLLLSAVFSVWCSVVRKSSRLRTPPGPKISALGLWQSSCVPRAFQWLTYTEWKKIYGDLIFLNILRNPILIINSVEVAQELLEKRGSVYSSRPVRAMLKDVMGFGFLFTGMPYNSWYKQHRAMFHKHFRRGAIPNYHSIQYKHINTLLRNLVRMPDSLELVLRSVAAARLGSG